MHLSTMMRLAKKSFLHPSRAVVRGMGLISQALLDVDEERRRLFAFLEDAFDADTDKLQREFAASEFTEWTRSRREALENFQGPYRFGSTGVWDCECLYYLVRALKPRATVETGVCYGASSSYILEALARNGGGTLYSIDLGNAPEEPPNDFFVHPSQKQNWHLIIGDSRIELPRLLKRLRRIDLFHHDSLHTYEHMMWEYETAYRYLDPTGAISSDDVNVPLTLMRPFQHCPFEDFAERHHLKAQTVLKFGVTVYSSPIAARLRRKRIHSLVSDAATPVRHESVHRPSKIA